ncbi:MAG: PH domain-containing protein [Candidatus Peribacteraceae bacterium]|nr:PH domain-containing protein [Candidatus Peribacteraceae bacterium]
MLVGQRHFHRHVDDDEEIVMVVHKHWLLGFKYLFWPVLAFAFAWAVFVFAPYKFIFYIAALASIGTLVWGLRSFYDYYLDAWIITDQGIIDVEWHGWFHRQSTRVLYSDIQGVSYEIQGVLGTMLRFGAIAVEKISTGSVLSMDSVKNPRAIEALILQAMEGYLHGKNLTDAKHVQDILSQLVAREVNLEQFESDDDDDEYDDDEYLDEDDDDDDDDD